MNTIKDLRETQQREIDQFIQDCPHLDITVEDESFGWERSITIRCKRCRLNLVGYIVNKSQSYLSYVRDCIAKYPGNIK